MTSYDTVNLATQLFQHNALSLFIGEKVKIVDPETGKEKQFSLPAFGAVVSNLPFVAFEIIPKDDKEEISKLADRFELDGRSDLYCYIAAKIADMIRPGGNLGIILSNSWIGTDAGIKFINILKEIYNINQIHISGKGRWFKNADVVTTIMVLEKKNNESNSKNIDFWLWKKSLSDFSADKDTEEILINSALLRTEINPRISELSSYSQKQIDELLKLNICYNAFFYNVSWLLDLKDKIVSLDTVFHVFRGSRRGWDPLFYPEKGKHHIEDIYLKSVLKNAKNVNTLITDANGEAFCCGASIDDLKRLGHVGALEWISKFSGQKNGVGKLLPEVLKRKDMKWYELRNNEIAELFTTMNPDQRLFFARFKRPSFINQRLIGLTHKPAYPDMELNHALLNSIFTMFYIEASGFGRGLGALDIRKKSVSNCYMLNPNLVSPSNRKRILEAFEKIKNREIMKVSDELQDADRLLFEHEILRSFGIDEYFDRIKNSLLSMQQTRITAKLE